MAFEIMIKQEILDGIGTVAVAQYHTKGNKLVVIIPQITNHGSSMVTSSNVKFVGKLKLNEMDLIDRINLRHKLVLDKWDFEKFPDNKLIVVMYELIIDPAINGR